MEMKQNINKENSPTSCRDKRNEGSLAFRLRVVYNFGDSDCTHARADFFVGRVEHSPRAEKFRACVCISCAPRSPSPKL